MENFGAFYEQAIFIIWAILGAVSVLLIFYRLCRLFVHYINTGDISIFYDSCYFYHLVDGDGFTPKYMLFLFRGIHPGAIITDLISYFIITFLAGILWLPLSIIFPFIGAAYLLRKHIAKKQNFVAKLDGTHPDLQDNGFNAGETQSPSTRTP